MADKKINFQKLEKKWQKKWAEKKVFEVSEKKGKKKYYVLEMYPYPSASFLHMGHVRNYTIGDVYARFKRMNGFNVLYPMGYDSFGLPAEMAAKKEGVHPKKYAESAIKKIMEYQKALGNSYDWSRIIASHEPDYYRWNQYFFAKLLEKGLAYRKKAPVNWCEHCESVLANEEAEGGKCWRCGNEVVEKDLEQWFLKITAYADKLLKDLDKIRWHDKVKTMQRNWIGRSEGTEILFEINGEKWPVFTTRPDTVYGVTFMVIAPKHRRLSEFVTSEQKPEVDKFLKKFKDLAQRDIETLEKEGVFTGTYATNLVTGDKIPLYVGNFVLAEYGSGMIMAVPAHDQRDFEFAKKYDLPVKVVIEPLDKGEFYVIISDRDDSKIANKIRDLARYSEQVSPEEKSYSLAEKSKKEIGKLIENKEILSKGNNFLIRYPHTGDVFEYTGAFIGEGKLVNSGKFSGMNNREAIPKVTKYLEQKKIGKKDVVYRLRDWLISRQRYWGTPIPVIHCDKCGIVPVPERDLPVKLPEKVDFKASGNPLASNKSFVDVKCPKCKGNAERETDTMGGFVDSSWYFLRYCDNKNKKKAFDEKKTKYWMPVDQYIGGTEHAVMHLLYARFFVKALKDLGFVSFDEPFTKLFNQGIVYKDGAKMSKSKGNVVFQTEISEKYGIDTARLFLMFVSSPDKQMEWNDAGVEGSFRIINKLVRLSDKVVKGSDAIQESKVHSMIKKVSTAIENFEYPKAVVSMLGVLDRFADGISKENYKSLLKLFHPFCPHVTEELWEKVGEKGFISLAKWPVADEKKIDEKLEEAEKSVEKSVGDVMNIVSMLKEKGKKAEKVYVYVLPKEFGGYDEKAMGKKTGLKVKIYKVDDKDKYDPQGKAKKAKPGKPAIYVE